MQRTVTAALALTFLVVAPLASQTIVLEAEAGIEALLHCQWLQNQETGQWEHISNEVPPSVGGILQLDQKRYIVEWMGPGYHLESGVILQPTGAEKRGLKGQRWLEVYPDKGRIRTSRDWKDVDGNRALSASDTLALETGPALVVEDVRLQLRVRPAPPEG